jgi:DNA-binding NarL/FixJ family response regulator
MPIGELRAPIEAGPALLFFIDRQSVGRDCISERLASLLPEWHVEPMSEAGELHQHVNWAPSSVLILNVHGKSMGNPDVAGEMAMLAKLAPALPILIMSELCDVSEMTLAFGLGARGYLPTSLAISEVSAIVRLVAAGGTYVPANILGPLFETHRPVPVQIPDEIAGPCGFSPRQLQVLERLSEGKPNKVIAYELGMAESTVKVHIRHIMKKLNAHSRTQVVLMTKNALPFRSVSVAAEVESGLPRSEFGRAVSVGSSPILRVGRRHAPSA